MRIFEQVPDVDLLPVTTSITA